MGCSRLSRSGERRLSSSLQAVSKNRNGTTPSAFGTCFATPSERVSSQSSIELPENDAAPPEPDGHREALLTPEDSDPALHMEFLREAVLFQDTRCFLRAIQHGQRHASFPLLFSWEALSPNLRKYVVYCFSEHQPPRPALPLLPLERDT